MPISACSTLSYSQYVFNQPVLKLRVRIRGRVNIYQLFGGVGGGCWAIVFLVWWGGGHETKSSLNGGGGVKISFMIP